MPEERKSGTIQVNLVYAGRSVPTPVPDPNEPTFSTCPDCGFEKWDGLHGHAWAGKRTPPKTRWCTPTRAPHTCLRCGHSWKSNARTRDRAPRQCPECHSPYWNRQKRKFKKALADEARAILSGPKLSMQDFEKELKR